jgi:hypothetical protein
VLGAPIVRSHNLRLGFSFTKPVSWSPSRIEGAIESPETNESFLYSAYVSFSTFIPALNPGRPGHGSGGPDPGSSRVTYQNSVFSGAESRDIAFRDDEMTFEYKPPLLAGAAARFGQAEVEVDVRYHGSRDGYVLFSSEVPAALVRTDATGTPSEGTLAFADIVEETKAVTNVLRASGFTPDSSPTTARSRIPRPRSSAPSTWLASRRACRSGPASSPRRPASRIPRHQRRARGRAHNLLYAVSTAFACRAEVPNQHAGAPLRRLVTSSRAGRARCPSAR